MKKNMNYAEKKNLIIETLKRRAEEWFKTHDYHNSEDDIVLHEDVVVETMEELNIEETIENCETLEYLLNKYILGWEVC